MDTPTKRNTGQDMSQPKWVPVLVAVVAVLLGGVVVAPLALSGQDIMDWARQGLNLSSKWPWVVFYALDASAAICVLTCVYFAWTGQKAGLVRIAVWVIAGMSATAQYNHGTSIKDTAPDAWWFFPALALIGPALLEMLLWKVRTEQMRRKGQIAKETPKFSFWRWIPGVGSFTETYGSWRVARLMNLSSYEASVQEYRRLCPNGGFKVLKAIRAEQYSTKQVQAPAPKPEVQASTEPKILRVQSSRQTDDEKYLSIIRKEWPNQIPSGYQIRKKLNVNYVKSKKLLETLEKEENK